ncbi:chemotaxis protein CheA [Acetobacter persici]|uniref:chemotaxis protein CheA n=1 Tax=Acetobacter persici TaxID=1076596 RepID=UPI001FCBDE7B|nr:chemotaxis protein CheA [Acetobacter persici]
MDVLSDLVSEADGSGEHVPDDHIASHEKSLLSVIEMGGGSGPSEIGASPAPADFTPMAFEGFDLEDDLDLTPDSSGLVIVGFRPLDDLYRRADDPRNILSALKALNAEDEVFLVECDMSALPPLADLDVEKSYLSWSVTLPGSVTDEAITEVFDWTGDACEMTISRIGGDGPEGGGAPPAGEESAATEEAPTVQDEPAKPAPPPPAPASVTPIPVREAQKARAPRRPQDATIRVDLPRIDGLMDLVGEMVIAMSSMESACSMPHGQAREDEVKQCLGGIKSLTRDIQDSVMGLRAQPVKSVFQRMQRVVREASQIAKKSIILELEGENTEVDRTIVEQLTDPLTHMLRNAVDHGVESAEKRLANGKPKEGKIILSAGHRSGRIVISIKDDGGGINKQRVLQIAKEKGIVSSDAALSDDEINELIFAPGFSTAATISDLSGRGVGMDVVKQAIQALGGRVSIKSEEGVGTTFDLSLPLTLAVMDGMFVACRGNLMVVPLASTVETMKIYPETRINRLPNGGMAVALRGDFLPLVVLGDELGLHDPAGLAGYDLLGKDILVVENESGAKAAIVVDSIHQQAQVVIKSLDKNYKNVAGVSAATILGDGSVALIIDVPSIVSTVTRRLDTRSNPASKKRAA